MQGSAPREDSCVAGTAIHHPDASRHWDLLSNSYESISTTPPVNLVDRFRPPTGGSLVDGASIAPESIETSTTGTSQGQHNKSDGAILNPRHTVSSRLFVVPSPRELSGWSLSGAKRIFDCSCVALALPVLI